MSEEEPRRWKDSDEGPAPLKALLRKAHDEVPPLTPGIRAAVLASLPNPPAGGGGGGTGGGLSISSAAIGGGVIVAIVLAAVVFLRPAPPAHPQPAPSLSVAVLPSASPPPTTSIAEPAPSASASPAITAHAPAPKPSPAPSASGDSLADELALIAQAQKSFDANPSGALASIDDHARRFPNGQLAPEREYLRIRALRKLGRVDEAKTRCRAYLKTFPSSPHGKAVRDMLAEMEAR